MNTIGDALNPVYINDRGVPKKISEGAGALKDKLAIGMDANGALKATDLATGGAGYDDTKIATKGYVDSKIPSVPTNGRLLERVDGKFHVKVDDSLKNTDGSVKSADFVGIGTNGQLVAAVASPVFKFPNYSSKQEDRIVLVSDNSNNDSYIDDTYYQYDSTSFKCVKNEDPYSYKEVTPTVDSLIMVILVRSQNAPAANVKLAGLDFKFKLTSGSQISDIFSYHPHDENGYNSEILWYRGCIFQGNFKAGSTLRIQLNEETGVNLQTPPFLKILRFPLY